MFDEGISTTTNENASANYLTLIDKVKVGIADHRHCVT